MAAEDTSSVGAADAADFAANGYVVVPALLEPALTAFLWKYALMKAVSGKMRGGDKAVPGAMVRYGDDVFEALLENVRPRIEARTGLRLLPTYSYFRMYARGNDLRRHCDRSACEISVSLNLGQIPDAPWPLHLAGAMGSVSAALHPGDAVIYRGIDLAHWREPYGGERLAQAFLHYVDKDGPHADQRFDGRAGLMTPKPTRQSGDLQHRDE